MPVNVMAVDAPTALVTQKSCPAAVGKGTAIVQVVVQIPYPCGSVTLNAPLGVGRGVAGRSAATTVRIPGRGRAGGWSREKCVRSSIGRRIESVGDLRGCV